MNSTTRRFSGFWSALKGSASEQPLTPSVETNEANKSDKTDVGSTKTSPAGSALKRAILAGRGMSKGSEGSGSHNVVAIEIPKTLKSDQPMVRMPIESNKPIMAATRRVRISLSPLTPSTLKSAESSSTSIAVAAKQQSQHLPNFMNDADSRETVLAKRVITSRKALEKGVAQITPPTLGKKARSSSIRYKADVNQGQHRYTIELMKVIRANKDPRLTIEESIHQQCDFLNPRERLDLLRMAAQMSGASRGHRKVHKGSSPTVNLPKYWSEEFGRYFYFQESELTEKSALGTGPGGQATNRRRQSIHVKHIPSNTIIRFSHFTSLHANRRAARMMLNLQIEHQLLGENSTLGRKQAAMKRAAEIKVKKRAQLERQSDSVTRKARHRHSFVGFLLGHWGLPAFVAPRCEVLGTLPTENSSNKSTNTSTKGVGGQLVTISSLLDTHANRWWSILSESFYHHWCRPVTVKTYVRVDDTTMKMKRRVCGWVIGATRAVPCWFCYAFPIVGKAPKPLEKPDKETIRLATKTNLSPASPIPLQTTAIPLLSTFAPSTATNDASSQTQEAPATSSTVSASSPEAIVDSLMAAAASSEDSVDKEQAKAREIYFNYLRQKKKYDIVARTVQYHEDQLNQLKTLPDQCKTVASIVRTVVEAFGMYLEVTDDAKPVDISFHSNGRPQHLLLQAFPKRSVRLHVDVARWRECCERLHTPDEAHLTPISAAIFPHMIRSLKRLNMSAEAGALEDFFVEKQQKHKWAAAMVELIKQNEISSDEERVADRLATGIQ